MARAEPNALLRPSTGAYAQRGNSASALSRSTPCSCSAVKPSKLVQRWASPRSDVSEHVEAQHVDETAGIPANLHIRFPRIRHRLFASEQLSYNL
jgi:hypothetical protein